MSAAPWLQGHTGKGSGAAGAGKSKGKTKEQHMEAPSWASSAPTWSGSTSWQGLQEENNAQVKLDTLLAAVQKLPQIPEQLQKAVADAASQSTRSLHQAVTRMGQCKKTLSELQGAWSTRLGAWEAYVTEVQESWKRNLADFQEEEESYLKKLADAEKELGVARKAVRDASKKASKEVETLSAEEAKELDDAISVDSEELMTDGAGTHSAWTAQTALNAFRVRGSSQKKRMEEFAEKLKVEQEEKKVKETLGRERSPRRRSKSPEIPVEGPEGEAEKVF